MRSPSVLIGWPLLGVFLFACAARAADTATNHASPSIAAQTNDAANLHAPAAQPSGSASLAIPAQQPGCVDDAGTRDSAVGQGSGA